MKFLDLHTCTECAEKTETGTFLSPGQGQVGLSDIWDLCNDLGLFCSAHWGINCMLACNESLQSRLRQGQYLISEEASWESHLRIVRAHVSNPA